MSNNYVPLTGAEVREAIIRKIEALMDLDMRFRECLTYPLVQWDFTLNINGWPDEMQMFTTSVASRVVNPGVPPCADGPIKQHVEPKGPIAVVLTDTVDTRAGHPAAGPDAKAPDEVRADVGLPLTTMQTVKVGNAAMIFDAVAKDRGRTGRGRGEGK